MDPIFGLLFIAGLLWAGKNAGKHVAAGIRRSRPRHALGWVAGEVRHGFPVTRGGFASGWLAHRTAMDQYRARREEARTSHLEARASILSELSAHRRRQAAAQARIDAAGQPLLDEMAAKRRDKKAAPSDTGGTCIYCGAADGQECAPDCPYRNQDWRAMSRIKRSRRVDGQPETEADTRFFDRRESGYTGPIDQDGNIPDPDDPANARPLELLCLLGDQNGQSSTPAEGAPPMTATDASYTTAHDAAQKIEAEAEEAAAAAGNSPAGDLLDSMSGVGLDADTLSAFSELADAHREYVKAAERYGECATTARTTLERNHGGIKDAVDDAPVDQPAEPGFYGD